MIDPSKITIDTLRDLSEEDKKKVLRIRAEWLAKVRKESKRSYKCELSKMSILKRKEIARGYGLCLWCFEELDRKNSLRCKKCSHKTAKVRDRWVKNKDIQGILRAITRQENISKEGKDDKTTVQKTIW